jgi:hypothetical protein
VVSVPFENGLRVIPSGIPLVLLVLLELHGYRVLPAKKTQRLIITKVRNMDRNVHRLNSGPIFEDINLSSIQRVGAFFGCP